MGESWDLPAVTLIAVDMPLRDAVLDLANQAEISVSVPASEALITCNYNNVPAELVLRQLAQQSGLGVTYRDGVVNFGDEIDGREVYAVLDPGYAPPKEAADLFSIVLGSEGEVRELDGKLSYSGSREGLERALTVAEGYKLGPDAWRLTVVVYEVSDQVQRQLGVEVAAGFNGELGVGAAAGDLEQPVQGARAALSVTALGRLADSGTEAKVHTIGTLYLIEGQSSTLQQGDTVPVPRRVVSPEGTVSTEGYEYIESGFKVLANGRRVPGGLLLSLSPSVSSVTGFVEEAPILTQATVTGDVIVSSGEWVVLSGLRRSQKRVSSSGLPGIGKTMHRDELADGWLVVCVRADRIRQAFGGIGVSSSNEPEATIQPEFRRIDAPGYDQP